MQGSGNLMKLSKQQREREVFETLSRVIGLDVVAGSITQPDPPDIVCEIIGQGPLAVELVALDAPETGSGLDSMMATDKAWISALAPHPADHRARLRADTADVFFNIVFRNEAGTRDR